MTHIGNLPGDGHHSPDQGARIAEAVRAFYDRQPYPRPLSDLDSYRARWEDEGRRRSEHHRIWPGRPFAAPRSILVAGCGTAQAARYALREPGVSVIGIDVSESSLDATRALKTRYGLDNLELARIRLEDVGALQATFDLVICTGVIHHLPDPDRGLAALAEVLARDGAMHLMVYAPYGRTGVYLIQRYARLLGLEPSTQDLRALAATLAELPPAHPIRPLLGRSPDFRTEAGLADALLNPQDKPYSVPELFGLVTTAGLRFSRWIRQAPYHPQCGAPALTPHGDRLAALPEPEQFAAMELFRGNMTRHSAVLHRADDGEMHAIDFSGSDWLCHVPVRMRDTICVEEGIPESAVGVLINRNHADTDLYLPIDAREQAMLDAIDGERTIQDVAHGRVSEGAARTFFERLWWYDQVVFDTSDREVGGREGVASATSTSTAKAED